jgi:hypothetical protein
MLSGENALLAADGRPRGLQYYEGERRYHETFFDPVQGWIALE